METRGVVAVDDLDSLGWVDVDEGMDGDWAAHDAGPTQQSIKAMMRIESQSNRSIIQPLSTNGFLDMMTAPDAPSNPNHRIHRLIAVGMIMLSVGSSGMILRS